MRLGVTVMRTIEREYPEFEYTPPKNPAARWHIDLAAGGSELRTSGKSADELIGKWDAEAAAFAKENERYRLYD